MKNSSKYCCKCLLNGSMMLIIVNLIIVISFRLRSWKILTLTRRLLERKIEATISKSNVNLVCQNVAEIHSSILFPSCFRYNCIPAFIWNSRAQNSVLDCECLKSLQIYSDYFFKKWLWVLEIVTNISRTFLKIISNKVAPSLTVTSGFKMLFAKIPSNIFRFTIYWLLIKNW